MYTVEFYENDRGVSELWDFLVRAADKKRIQ